MALIVNKLSTQTIQDLTRYLKAQDHRCKPYEIIPTMSLCYMFSCYLRSHGQVSLSDKLVALQADGGASRVDVWMNSESMRGTRYYAIYQELKGAFT